MAVPDKFRPFMFITPIGLALLGAYPAIGSGTGQTGDRDSLRNRPDDSALVKNVWKKAYAQPPGGIKIAVLQNHWVSEGIMVQHGKIDEDGFMNLGIKNPYFHLSLLNGAIIDSFVVKGDTISIFPRHGSTLAETPKRRKVLQFDAALGSNIRFIYKDTTGVTVNSGTRLLYHFDSLSHTSLIAVAEGSVDHAGWSGKTGSRRVPEGVYIVAGISHVSHPQKLHTLQTAETRARLQRSLSRAGALDPTALDKADSYNHARLAPRDVYFRRFNIVVVRP